MLWSQKFSVGWFQPTHLEKYARQLGSFPQAPRDSLSSRLYYTGFAIITRNNPQKIGETLHHQGTNATCQSLGARFSQVTFRSYGGPRYITGHMTRAQGRLEGLREPPQFGSTRSRPPMTFRFSWRPRLVGARCRPSRTPEP